MKLKKLLVLSSAILMTFGVVATVTSCDNNQTSTVDVVTDKIQSAADYIWELYHGDNGKDAYDSFTLQKRVSIGGEFVNITWALNRTKGNETGLALVDATTIDPNANNDQLQGVYIGYYDEVIKDEKEFELVPTFSYGGTTKTLQEIKGAEKKITRTTKSLTVTSYADYMAKGKANKEELITVKGIVSHKAISNYLWINDLDGEHAYVCYSPANATQFKNVKAGDLVFVSGKAAYYNGLRQIKNYSIVVRESGKTVVAPADISSVYSVKDLNPNTNDTFAEKILNRDVVFKNVTIGEKGGYKDSYYYFTNTVNKKDYKCSLYWSTSYMLTKEENNTWAELFDAATGLKADITGVMGAYTPDFTIYPSSTSPIKIVDTEKNVAKKSAENLTNITAFYPTATNIALPESDILGSTITWSVNQTSDICKIENKTLKIAPTADAMSTFVVTATVKKGNETTTREFTISAQQLTDAQQANNAKDELVDVTIEGFKALPKTSPVYNKATITYAIKGTAEGFKVVDNYVAVPNVDGQTATLTATIKVGSTTVTKDITVTSKKTSTITAFETAKDNTHDQYIRGTIVVKNADKDAEGSFVLYDGEKYIFSYEKTKANVGDDVIVKAKYGTNNGVIQLGTSEVITMASNQTLPNIKTGATALSIDEVKAQLANAKTITDTAELNALKDTWFNTYGGKVIALTGTVKGNGDYINITTADGDAKKPFVQLSVAGDIKTTFAAKGTDGKYVNEGKVVTAYVIYRGNNVGNQNLQFQLIDFTVAEA